jgi:uncharacterized protein YciI
MSVMYVLVLFREGPRFDKREVDTDAHEAFVTSLIRRNLVLLGGDFGEAVAGVHAAYVLRCASVDEALAIAGEDPAFAAGVFDPHAVEWNLVGVNTDAVDQALTRRDV